MSDRDLARLRQSYPIINAFPLLAARIERLQAERDAAIRRAEAAEADAADLDRIINVSIAITEPVPVGLLPLVKTVLNAINRRRALTAERGQP